VAFDLKLGYQVGTPIPLQLSVKMFSGFNRSLLDDPDFKEDSVREIIITPLLTRLGYSPSGPDRIVRSKTLKHPFIYAGTRKCPINIIPDYTLLANSKPVLVLDAKRPTEDVLSRENVQQAYSYAVHPEIKCQHFALCNGNSLVVFDVENSTPLLVISFDEYESKWTEIELYLAPRFLKQPSLRKFAPDFGSALKRMGLNENAKITMLAAQLNWFARLNDELMTATANCEFVDRAHCVSFDFHPRFLPDTLAGLPAPLAAQFSDALSRSPFQAAAELTIELDIDTRLGAEIDGQSEKFIPLVIERVLASRFNHTPLVDEATDIPAHVFRLRRVYKIRSLDSEV
jgi:Type I restriction enzyme R protein N terminus (HSDR_N)